MTFEPKSGRQPRPVAVGLFMALAGPLLGAIPYASLFVFSYFFASTEQSSQVTLADAGSMLLLVSAFAYIFGTIPAAVTAVACAYATSKRGGFGYLFAASAAAASACVLGVTIGASTSGGSWTAPVTILLWPSLFAAVVARFVVARLGWIAADARRFNGSLSDH